MGDTLSILGPNRHVVGPDYGGVEFRPGTARTLLLAGDETAAPAICAILEALPESMCGHAVIEVGDASDRQRVLTRSDVMITWLVRGEEDHGVLLDAEVRRLMCENAQAFRADLRADATSASPADATDGSRADAADGSQDVVPELEDVDIGTTVLWETTTGRGAFYAWLAGEAGVIKGLRRHLVSEQGIDRSQVSFMGYWRKGRPEM